MRLDIPDLRPSPVGTRHSLLSLWRVGTIVPAMAVRDDADQLWLQIAGQRLAARLATPQATAPPHGALLRLQVLRTNPVLAVKVLADPANQAHKLLLNEALRRHLPRQQSPAPLLANLQWLAHHPPSPSANHRSLPTAVLQAAHQLWRGLPEVGDLTDPARLRQAMQHSGIFLEHSLTRADSAATASTSDLKALLLALLQVLKSQGSRTGVAHSEHLMNAPIPDARAALQVLRRAPATLTALDEPDQQMDELARQSEGALARLTSHQLTSAESSTGVLLMELPLRHTHQSSTLRLRVEREPRGKEDGENGWSLEATMDLGSDGSLHTRVHLRGKRVGVQLRAESPALQVRLAANLETLEQLLQRAGLQPESLVCRHGQPPTRGDGHHHRLLDEQA